MSELDSRLAEIGRRLEVIQAGLAPDVEFAPADLAPANPAPLVPVPPATPADVPPAPANEPPAASPEATTELEPAPDDASRSPRSGPLAALLARSRRRRTDGTGEDLAALVRMHNGLLSALSELVRLLGEPGGEPRPAATVSAGPFRTPEEVERFAARLSELPPVRAATIIGYEGADRALIEVQLGESTG